ncbi:hypothetical protein [Mycoplasmopsis bovis]
MKRFTKEEFFKNRITFGIRDEYNKIVGFSARALDKLLQECCIY